MFSETKHHWVTVPDKSGFWICPVDRLDEGRQRVASAQGVPVDMVIDYPQPRCRCCGNPVDVSSDIVHVRCHKHRDKNPCAVEGCERTRVANGRLHDGRHFLCRDHWRVACPPKSKWRQAYNRFFRTAKKLGLSRTERWPENLERRYWRYFGGLVARARRMAAGDLDMAEINKLFGWDE
jgi:hypothetical protein